MRRKRSLSTCSTIRLLMTSSVRLRAYISRSIRSSWLAGKTSPRTLKTLPVRWGSRSSSMLSIRSNSLWRTRPSRVAGGDEVEDQAVLLLAVAVDAAHALLQPHRVPGDVVVDHQPAELEVDALARRLGGDQHLAVLLELPLGIDARAGRVAVADLHAAVDVVTDRPHSRSLPSGLPDLPSPAR